MADIEIDVDAGGLEELAKQGKLSADALAKFARELNALQPSNQTANKGLNELSDIIKKLNTTAQGATSSGKKLAESIAEITKAAAEAKAIELQLAGALGSTQFQIDATGKSSDRAASSIKRQSAAISELIEKQKNFQLLSSSTNQQISSRGTNADKLIQIRRADALFQGNIFQSGIPIPVEELRGKNIDSSVARIRELRQPESTQRARLQSSQQQALIELQTISALKAQTTSSGEGGLLSQFGDAASLVALSQAAILFRQTFSLVKREIVDAIQAATQFNRQILAIRAISQDAQQSVSRFGEAITNVAVQFNLGQTDVAAAEYEILSQQIAKGAESFKVLTEAGKLAQITQTSAATSAKAISAAINAYGLSANDAERVSAILFRTIDLGSVTLDELANTIGRTGTIARTLGISLEESTAALQALTVQGVRGEDANTQYLNILNQLLSPNENLLKLLQSQGFASGEAAVETLKLSGVLALINKTAGGSAAALKDLLGDIRAVRGAAGTVNEGFTIFISNLEKTTNQSIPAARAAVQDFATNGVEQLSNSFNSVHKNAVQLTNDLLSIAAPEINVKIDRLAGAFKFLSEAQLDAAGNIKPLIQRIGALQQFGGDLLGLNGDRVGKRQVDESNAAARIQAIKDFNAKTLDEQRKAAIAVNSIQLENIRKIQQANFKERDERLATDKQITDSLINATNIRVKEVDKLLKKKEEEINQSQRLIDQLEKEKKAILDAQGVQRDKERIQDIENTIRTPQQLAGLRATGSASDQASSDATLNTETNRRNKLIERQFEINKARLEIEGAIAQPDLLQSDSGALERIKKLADHAKSLAQENLDDERKKRFELDAAIFNKRQELQGEVDKGVDNNPRISEVEQELGALLQKRSEEETRINSAVKEREAAFKLELDLQERIAKIAKDKLGTQEQVNEELRKAKDAQDAIHDLAKLDIFNKDGKAAFDTPEAASKRVSELLGNIARNTNDPELLKIANQATNRANSQIEIQKRIAEQTALQSKVSETNAQIQKALDLDAITIRVKALGSEFGNLDIQLAKFEERIKKIAAAAGVSGGVGAQGFAEGGSVSSRDSIPALLSPGEFVTNPASTSRFFNKLVAMNNGVDPSLPSGSTRFGDINVTVSGVNNANQIADELPAAIKKVLRRGTWRN